MSTDTEENQLEIKLASERKRLIEICSNSNFFTENEARNLPHFNMTEIVIGPVLGIGGFCDVNEITSIRLEERVTKEGQEYSELEDIYQAAEEQDDLEDIYQTAEEQDLHDTFNVKEARFYMSGNCYRDSNARYAIKRLSGELDTKRRGQGIFDLAMEAKFLSVVSHPNIIKMRGTASGDPIRSDFFLILDRLYGTLEEKILGEWKYRKNSNAGFCGGCCGIDQLKKKEFLLERMVAAYDLSAVFRHLHTKRLIYRDIKSENIGFDIRGDIKLFDFGLCRELPTDRKLLLSGGLYKMTGRTGSIRYMAPEVVLNNPYNEKADVFSFGTLLWEILAVKSPFQTFNWYDYTTQVVKSGYRPSMERSWPALTKELLKDCWCSEINDRPDFDRIASILRAEVNDLAEVENSEIINRTTHMMNRSNNSRHNRRAW